LLSLWSVLRNVLLKGWSTEVETLVHKVLVASTAVLHSLGGWPIVVI
jgi:hypothetical protein